MTEALRKSGVGAMIRDLCLRRRDEGTREPCDIASLVARVAPLAHKEAARRLARLAVVGDAHERQLARELAAVVRASVGVDELYLGGGGPAPRGKPQRYYYHTDSGDGYVTLTAATVTSSGEGTRS